MPEIIYIIILIAVVSASYKWLKELFHNLFYPDLPDIDTCPYGICDGYGWYDEVGPEPDEINTLRCLCNEELDYY